MNNKEMTAMYSVDATQEDLFPYRSTSVAINLDSGEFVSARMHLPLTTMQAEQTAILLAALQTPRASVIYTDSKNSADVYERYVKAGKGNKASALAKCFKELLLPNTELVYVPRKANRLADALANYCKKHNFTGYGRCDLGEKGLIVLEKRMSTLNEVIDLNRAITNWR